VNGGSEAKVRRTPDEVRAEIERTREEIVSSANALRREMAMRMDWKRWVRQNPGLFIAGALVLGFWLGMRGARRR
jgi:hypothetical protein